LPSSPDAAKKVCPCAAISVKKGSSVVLSVGFHAHEQLN
jgi:hypothetical protein